jgi:DNA repair protein RadC
LVFKSSKTVSAQYLWSAYLGTDNKNKQTLPKMQGKNIPIKDWAVDDRPREKLMLKGPEALSNSELLAILIHHGNKEKTAVEMAKDVLRLANDNLSELGRVSVKDLMKMPGIGQAKAVAIAAALELGRRRQAAVILPKTSIHNGRDVARYLQELLKDYTQEVFAVLYLNRANRVDHFEIITRGSISSTIADPRLLLKRALECDATSIVLCHNHPSGNLYPSQSDEDITQKIILAASYFDIKVLDHVIVSSCGYFSFADEGIL